MNKLIVNIQNYTSFSYPAYTNRGTDIPRPENPLFEIGEVVVITSDDQLEIGVILGCVDESYGEVRTDSSGMVSMDRIRSAKMEDFSIPNIRFVRRLLDECRKLNPQT